MDKIYDIAVIGGGPAGLTAALYGLRNGKSVLVIEKEVFGGQIVNSPKVENIPGFEQISGDEFGDLMLKQVQNNGGELLFDTVNKVESVENIIKLFLDFNEARYAKTLILATGTIYRKLNLNNEDKLIGKGVHFCAVCDGSFYADKKVVIIGGGNTAFVQAEVLSNIVGKLVILQDLPMFTSEKKVQDKFLNNNDVEMHVNTKVVEYLLNDGALCGLKYLENGEEKIIDCDGVFLAIGMVANNQAFSNVADIDEKGYFISDEYGKTKTANVFVAGDCRSKSLRQVATACSDGANAAIEACKYLDR